MTVSAVYDSFSPSAVSAVSAVSTHPSPPLLLFWVSLYKRAKDGKGFSITQMPHTYLHVCIYTVANAEPLSAPGFFFASKSNLNPVSILTSTFFTSSSPSSSSSFVASFFLFLVDVVLLPKKPALPPPPPV